jgi:SAM-dependent methyltransferase
MLAMSVGQIRSTRPLSDRWGCNRGTPIDRYYIEAFLERHAADIKGHVLELLNDDYSRRFGGDRITRQDILNLDSSSPEATIIGDLVNPATLPAEKFDCIIITQTLHLIFDMPAAIASVRRALRPGGTALITVPGITPLDRREFLDGWYWSLTEPALKRLLEGSFGTDNVTVETQGNLYAATAFLHGAAVEEVSKRKLGKFDRAYPVTVAGRAVASS